MLGEKKLIIGFCIINKLVENYEGGDSAICYSTLIKDMQINYFFNITYEEVDEIMDLINTICSRHDVLKKVISSDIKMLFEPIIISERRVDYLEDIKKKLQAELDDLSNIF